MTPPTDLVHDLAAEQEEELVAFGLVCLYEFSWSLSGEGLAPTEVARIAELALDQIRARHPTAQLRWVDWPPVADEARPVESGTPLDFFLDPDETQPRPLMALVLP